MIWSPNVAREDLERHHSRSAQPRPRPCLDTPIVTKPTAGHPSSGPNLDLVPAGQTEVDPTASCACRGRLPESGQRPDPQVVEKNWILSVVRNLRNLQQPNIKRESRAAQNHRKSFSQKLLSVPHRLGPLSTYSGLPTLGIARLVGTVFNSKTWSEKQPVSADSL